MVFYTKYKSPLGYSNGDNQIDSYGVDHSGFSTRDELMYQTARNEREQELIKNYNQQGINENYPQFGTNFWGNSANNYGFGVSNIENNIEKRQFTPIPDATVHNNGQNQTMMDNGKRQMTEVFFNPLFKFNGKKFSFHNGTEAIKLFDALSGRKNKQCKYNTAISSGPIPEGKWWVRQQNLQEYNDLSDVDKFISDISDLLKKVRIKTHIGKWSGGQSSWGSARIWLEPDVGTDTYGRNGFSIHGGDSYGSAGCIDLGPNMDEFVKIFKQIKKDVPLEVKYDQDCWIDDWENRN